MLPIPLLRRIYIKFFITSGTEISWGRHLRFFGVKKIKIGNDVSINRNVLLDGRTGLEIGDSVDIGEYTTIWSLEHDPNSNEHACRGAKVIIKDHVWIAPRCIILPGITIGRGAIIATGSVVTKNVDERTIVAGVPAKVIGRRTNELKYKLHH